MIARLLQHYQLPLAECCNVACGLICYYFQMKIKNFFELDKKLASIFMSCTAALVSTCKFYVEGQINCFLFTTYLLLVTFN